MKPLPRILKKSGCLVCTTLRDQTCEYYKKVWKILPILQKKMLYKKISIENLINCGSNKIVKNTRKISNSYQFFV